MEHPYRSEIEKRWEQAKALSDAGKVDGDLIGVCACEVCDCGGPRLLEGHEPDVNGLGVPASARCRQCIAAVGGDA